MPLPQMNEFWTAFAAIAAALSIAGGAYAFGRNNGYRQAMRDLNNEREAKRFAEIYAPMMGFFTTCHITTARGRGAPYLSQRLWNAIELVKEIKLLGAFRALFDKQDLGTSGEVEYGGPFPLSAITKHLKGREHFADQRLIIFVAHANRSQHEDQPEGSDLTDADLALFNHVFRQHEILARRFVGA